MAQTVSTGAFSFPTVNEGSCMSVPKIFTYNNKPLLTLRDGQDGNGGVSARINVYDENIELVKSFDVKDDLKFYYTLTYKVQQRDVRHVNKTVRFKEQQSGYRNISEWIAEQNRYGNDVSKALSFTRQENGDTLVTVDYDKVEMVGGRISLIPPSDCNIPCVTGFLRRSPTMIMAGAICINMMPYIMWNTATGAMRERRMWTSPPVFLISICAT